MKNYYEILEVDKKASDEIIKLAYKSLVKKYHPDLKEGEEKRIAEEKIKQINEAYDTLSNPTLRSDYDNTLIEEKISPEQYYSLLNENKNLKSQINYMKNYYTSKYDVSNYSNQDYEQHNYNTDNSSNYNNNNYNYKKMSFFKSIIYSFSDSLKIIFALTLTFLIIFLFFKIPFLNDLLMNLFSKEFIIIIFVVIAFFLFFRNKEH